MSSIPCNIRLQELIRFIQLLLIEMSGSVAAQDIHHVDRMPSFVLEYEQQLIFFIWRRRLSHTSLHTRPFLV